MAERRPGGACQLAVGLRDDVTYVLVAQLRRGNAYLEDPCGLTVKVAEFAVQHLKAANHLQRLEGGNPRSGSADPAPSSRPPRSGARHDQNALFC